MPDIYEQHQSAFAQVSAFVILNHKGDLVARIALKFPRDGAGRLYAYVHVLGLPMVRAYAGGFGYDKRSAAISHAVARIKASPPYCPDFPNQSIAYQTEIRDIAIANDALANTWRIMAGRLDSGDDWTLTLEKAGFKVIQAV